MIPTAGRDRTRSRAHTDGDQDTHRELVEGHQVSPSPTPGMGVSNPCQASHPQLTGPAGNQNHETSGMTLGACGLSGRSTPRGLTRSRPQAWVRHGIRVSSCPLITRSPTSLSGAGHTIRSCRSPSAGVTPPRSPSTGCVRGITTPTLFRSGASEQAKPAGPHQTSRQAPPSCDTHAKTSPR